MLASETTDGYNMIHQAQQVGLADRVRFRQGDSQYLPFDADSCDAVIKRCA